MTPFPYAWICENGLVNDSDKKLLHSFLHCPLMSGD